MAKAKWFFTNQCTSLTIQRMKAEHGLRATNSLRIEDSLAINRLIKRIEAISAHGEVMKSMLVDEELQLIFECGSEKNIIKIFDGRLQTPSTGFNASEKDQKLELALYRDFKNLLNAEIGQNVLLIKGMTNHFDDFGIVFLGTTMREQKPGEPSIGPISTERFEVQTKSGSKMILEVVSGQNAPEPIDFQINGKEFTLYTFLDEKNSRLDPDYFKIGLRKK